MSGSVNSLGLGSGVLTSDLIDKLKANDVANMIAPIDRKIALQKQKDTAFDLLDSLLSTFKTSVSSLDNDTLYQKRSVGGTNGSVSVTASTGVAVQSFTISDVALAKKHVIESGSFSTSTSAVATGSGTMALAIDGKSYAVDYTSSTTLEDLKTTINNKAGDKVQASILQIGANDYRLILTSAKTGADQAITISDSATGTLNSTLLSYKKIESQIFSSPIDKIATAAGSLSVQMGDTSYNVDYDATTSLENLRDLINTSVGSSVASIDGSNRLVLRASIAGSTTNLSLSDNSGFLDSKLINYTSPNIIEEIQTPKDALFKYNGITVSRSNNEISDVIVGVSIKLLNETEDANITITQDVDVISTEMTTMVQSYNTLISQLNDMTTSNAQTGAVGIFNGDNSIKSISREINRLITSSTNGLSLPDFGIELTRTGSMTFNSNTFLAKFNANPSASEAFLSGSTTVDKKGDIITKDGAFTSMDNLLDRYTKSSGILANLTTGSATELKALTSSKIRSQALLDARYTTMMARFSQYDSIMTKLAGQFSSLQTQISAYSNGG